MLCRWFVGDVIETECSVFKQLQKTYGLEYGLPFSGDAASLNHSNVTGSFYQVLPWTQWFAPLCGADFVRPMYKKWREAMEASWDRKHRTCRGSIDFEAKKAPGSARCGIGVGAGGALWSPMALERWGS